MRLRFSLAATWLAALPFGLSGCATSSLQAGYWQRDPEGPFEGTPIYVFGGTILDVGAVIGKTRYDAGELSFGFLMILDLPFSLAADTLLLPLCIYQQFERATWEEGEFIERLADSDAEVRAKAAEALGVLGGTTHATVEALEGVVDDEDRLVRSAALDSLGELGKESASALAAILGSLDDPEVGVRVAAVRALGLIGADPGRVNPALIRALGDPEGRVRAQAVVALDRMGGEDPSVLAALEHTAQHDDFSTVREAAQEVIDRRRRTRK